MRPLSATSRYGPERDAVAVGRDLGTDLVLDGAIQRAADRLRIHASLVRVADGRTVWMDRFDTAWADIFSVQDAIAEQVGRAMAAVSATIAARGTSPHRECRRVRDVSQGAVLLEHADHRCLAAVAGVFRAGHRAGPRVCVGLRGAHRHVSDAWIDAVRGAAGSEAAARRQGRGEQGARLDDTSAEAHTSLAFVTYAFDSQWAAGEREFLRAIELDPTYVTARSWYAGYLGLIGRVREGIDEAERARALDPLSLIGTTRSGCRATSPGATT